MKLSQPLSLGFLFILLNFSLFAQDQELPKVFIMGQDEVIYETLEEQYQESLLSVCNNDMRTMMENWYTMMLEIESYANKIQFDIKGMKLFMNVYWNKEGKIEHLGYILRPDSKNKPYEELTAFFSSFVARHEGSVNSASGFKHYAVAAFPTLLNERSSN